MMEYRSNPGDNDKKLMFLVLFLHNPTVAIAYGQSFMDSNKGHIGRYVGAFL